MTENLCVLLISMFERFAFLLYFTQLSKSISNNAKWRNDVEWIFLYNIWIFLFNKIHSRLIILGIPKIELKYTKQCDLISFIKIIIHLLTENLEQSYMILSPVFSFFTTWFVFSSVLILSSYYSFWAIVFHGPNNSSKVTAKTGIIFQILNIA